MSARHTSALIAACPHTKKPIPRLGILVRYCKGCEVTITCKVKALRQTKQRHRRYNMSIGFSDRYIQPSSIILQHFCLHGQGRDCTNGPYGFSSKSGAVLVEI